MDQRKEARNCIPDDLDFMDSLIRDASKAQLKFSDEINELIKVLLNFLRNIEFKCSDDLKAGFIQRRNKLLKIIELRVS